MLDRLGVVGLDYFGARYMSAAQGRFTTIDPSMESVHLQNPQSWNRYSYAINNPLRYVDPNGELWISTNNANSPYTWVDSCGERQTCYESVSVVQNNTLYIYGSWGRTDVTLITANDQGYIDLSQVAQQHDANFVIKAGASPFVSLETANGFFNTTAEYHEQHPDAQKFVITDAGKADGSPLPPHKTHDLGRSIDLRYQDPSGRNLRGGTAAERADVAHTRELVGMANSAGFNQNYSARPKQFGTTYAQGHADHLHLGKIKPPNKPK